MVVRVFWWWALAARGWPPLLLHLSDAHPIDSQKFSKMIQLAWGGRVSWWSHIPALKVSAQLSYLHNIDVFCKPTPCASRVSLGLPHSLIKMRKFPKHNCWFRSLLISIIFINFSRWMFKTFAHSGLGMFVTNVHPSLDLHNVLCCICIKKKKTNT